MGPTVFGPGEGVDVPPHPHIGLATVTYLLKGEIVHRDTTGVTQVISPGAVNWMSAGSGVVHSERTPADLRAAGHVLEGLQLWITLPANAVETDPYFHHYDADAIPAFEAADGKARGTVVLGSGYGVTSPVDLPLDAVMVVADVAAGAELDIPPCDECSVYVMDGQVAIGETTVGSDALAVLGKAGRKGVRRTGVVAQTDAKVALFGGATCDERFHWWNFVATSRERLKVGRAGCGLYFCGIVEVGQCVVGGAALVEPVLVWRSASRRSLLALTLLSRSIPCVADCARRLGRGALPRTFGGP